MASPSDNEILNNLYPKEPRKKEVKEQPMTKARALSGVDKMDYAPSSVKETPADRRAERFVEQMDLPTEEAQETLGRAARERAEGARHSVGGFFSNLGATASEMKEQYIPSDEKKRENVRRAFAGETLEGQRTESKEEEAMHGPEPTSYLDEELVTLGKGKDVIGRGEYADPWYARRLAEETEKKNQVLIFTNKYEGDKSLAQNYKTGGIMRKEDALKIRVGNDREYIAEYKKVPQFPGQVIQYTGAAAGGIVQGTLKAKGYLSETKLKYDASRYGISPEKFDAIVNAKDEKGNPMKFSIYVPGPKGGKGSNKLVTGGEYVANIIAEGKAKEMRLKTSEQAIKASQATVKNIEASTALRYAKEEQMQATVPQGGRKLVQFGSSNFGQTPYYVNAAGTHGAIRSQFLPGQMSGVSTSLANSRLEMARMKQRVLGGAGGSYGAVQSLMPQSQSQNTAIISRLSPGGNQGPRPPGGAGMGRTTVLTKLSALRRRP